MLRRLLWHWLVLAFGLYLLTVIKPLGITADTDADLAWAAVVLILANTFLKPILIFFTLPLVLITLGLFIFIINAIILDLLPHIVHGFHVPGFWSALFGSIILSLITGMFSGWDRRTARRQRGAAPQQRNEVIDI
jgi:putative membrane protein